MGKEGRTPKRMPEGERPLGREPERKELNEEGRLEAFEKGHGNHTEDKGVDQNFRREN